MIIFKLIVNAIRHLVCNDPPAPPPQKPFPTEAEIDAKFAEIVKERDLKDNDFKHSLTDTLIVLGIPNTFHYRGGLYMELGGEGEYRGSASQNVWMIGELRRRFAEGRID